VKSIFFTDDELNEARNAVAKASQDQIKTANDAVVKTSTAMTELGKAQMQILEQTIKLQVNAMNSLVKTQRDYDQLRADSQEQQKKLEDQIRDKEKKISEKEQEKAGVERDLDSSKSSLAKLREESTNLQKTHEIAIETLGTVGTLVDDSSEVLRAVATTEGVRSILMRSSALLQKAKLPPRLQYRRVQIALAFADLEGFVGDPSKQMELASGALDLIANLRDSGQLPESGLTESVLLADEAMARVFVGDALYAKEDFPKSIEETTKSIDLYDRALASEALDRRSRVKWQQRQAQAYEHLGRTIDRYHHDHDEAVNTLQKAVGIFQQLSEEYPSDRSYVAKIAWLRFNIAEVERDHQALDAASIQYKLARDSMDEFSDYVRRSNEWLDRASRIYNGSAELLINQVLSSESFQDPDAMDAQRNELEQRLSQALGFVTKAKAITEELVRSDGLNLAWQTTHGWSLQNLGAVEFAHGVLASSADKLSASIGDFEKAIAVRNALFNRARERFDWRWDLRWTQLHLNTAKGQLAKVNRDYGAMRDLFAENVKLVDEALSVDPKSDDWRRLRVENQVSSADAMMLLGGQEADARKIYDEMRTVAVTQMGTAKQKGERDRWARLINRIDRARAGLNVR
jgi:tetratricopeptide (TPR) repeat protein